MQRNNDPYIETGIHTEENVIHTEGRKQETVCESSGHLT